jgi:MerR family transcriptional regulator, copper efflux regulator
MRIGLLAKRAGLSVDTIRFYEKKGLLDSNSIARQRNNYRDYSEASLEQLMFIRNAKNLGFTLTEIQEWMRGIKSDRLTAKEKCAIIIRKLQEIDERVEKLKKMKIPLMTCLDKYQNET